MRKNIWKNGALSPVLFFVDDLSNRWVDVNGDDNFEKMTRVHKDLEIKADKR